MTAGWAGALLAALPVALVLGLMGLFRVKGYQAVLAGTAGAALEGVLFWHSPGATVARAASAGAYKGLFPVVYIVAASLVLYNLTVATGHAGKLRQGVETVTRERSLQLLLVGYGFAAFLDATAGFLTPVVVATSMLVSLDVPPMEAAAYTLVASALPAVFGAMGIPVLVLSDASGIAVSTLAPALAVGAGIAMGLMPLFLLGAFGGRRELRRLWFPAVAAGAGYAVMLVLAACFVSYAVAAVAAALGAMVALGWAAGRGGARDGAAGLLTWSFLEPWLPYLITVGVVLFWTLPAVKGTLGAYLGSPGTAILVSAILFDLVVRAPFRAWGRALSDSGRQLWIPAVSICAVFAMAEMMKSTGMTGALGAEVSRSGSFFPLLSPFLQWVASAITGSNTTSIAMVGGLQASAARALGLSPVVSTVLVGVSAAVGKMVAPQVLSAGAAAAGLTGREGGLLRIGIRYSMAIMLLLSLAGWLLVRL